VSSEIAELVAAAQGGDRASFAELYARFVRFVHGIVRARVATVDVDDLVQDVFLTAMQRLPSLRDRAAFGGWLAAIARNHSTDHLRRVPVVEALPPSSAARTTSDESLVEARAVMDVIRSLPEAYRDTLTLRLVEGMTGPEIAACSGLTEGSVRVNLHRGMKLLRERLERRSA
jgi:RNA polymerase sigma-70 factor (ECF subfamily)